MSASLHRGVVHETGHAVMARLLRVGLVTIEVDLADPAANARVRTCHTDDPARRMRIAAASRACLLAFGFGYVIDKGTTNDFMDIENALSEMFEDDDAGRAAYELAMHAEVERVFTRPDVRTAVEALVGALMRTGRVDGDEATEIIDGHIAKAPPSSA
jgi:hypothetical protein